MPKSRRMISIDSATHDQLKDALIHYVAEHRKMVSLTTFTTYVIQVGLAAITKDEAHPPTSGKKP